jgi:LacI family transcriptional regulator
MARRASESTGAHRRSTIREVADRAGVSVATVSRILSGNYPAAPATRNRVMRAVKELDYVVNAHARALAGSPSKSVAIVLNSVISPHYAHVAQGVEAQAATEGRLCLIGTTGGDSERELAMVKFMREQHAEAVILVGNIVVNEQYVERMSQYARVLTAVGSKLVLCGRPPLGADVPAIVVGYDNADGAFAVTSHLLSAGHRRILCLGRRSGYTTSEGRVAGYRQALAAHHLPHDPGLEVDGKMTWNEGYRMMRERLAAGPRDFTAVFALNDLIAGGARKAMLEQGISVPEDISMVGFDNLPPSADIDLTTVHLPHEEIGRTAVRLALGQESQGGGPEHVVLGTHLVVRDSVRHRIP